MAHPYGVDVGSKWESVELNFATGPETDNGGATGWVEKVRDHMEHHYSTTGSGLALAAKDREEKKKTSMTPTER